MTELEDVIRGWAELTEVEEEPPRWVRANPPERINFAAVRSTLGLKEDDAMQFSGSEKDYLDLERELVGDEWLLAAVTREEDGYLREDLATNAAVEFVSSAAYPPLDRSPKKNWVDQVGGLPDFIERIAKHVHYEAGRPIGMAIAIAVSTVKKWCAGGEVHQFPGIQVLGAKARAQACKAVAEWEAKKGQSKAKRAAS